MKSALGYVRLSKEDEKSVSIEYQRAAIERLCQTYNLELVGIECDSGMTGKHLNRAGVQKVLQAVKERTVDAIVVFKSDRLSRNGIESLQIENLFQSSGIQYLSATEGVLSNSTADDEFMAFIRAGLNQRERRIISLRTRYALQQKRETGQRLGRPPRGWKVLNGELVQDTSEQSVIERVRDLNRRGYSTRKIAQLLDNEGITRGSKPINQSFVSRVLLGGNNERAKRPHDENS